MNEMTVKAVITADTTYRVEGDSYEPVGNIHPVDDPTPVSVTQGSCWNAICAPLISVMTAS